MNIKMFILLCFVAAGFSLWPIAGKSTGLSRGWVISLVFLGSTATVFLLSLKELGGGILPSARNVVLLLGLGVFNGLAIYLYMAKITEGIVSASMLVVTVAVLMAVESPIFDYFFNSARFTYSQILGIGFACFTIWLLNR